MGRLIVAESGIVYEWDTGKAKRNLAKHGIAFGQVRFFKWDRATTVEDGRLNYGENRYVTYGAIGDRLHVLVWTRRGHALRIISFRKANAREFEKYGQAEAYSSDG